jgi:ELWxxDGT repeat protein
MRRATLLIAVYVLLLPAYTVTAEKLYSGPDKQALVTAGDAVYFTATDEAAGEELWAVRDGDSMPRRVADLNPGPDGVGILAMVEFNGALCALTANPTPVFWRISGVEQPPIKLVDLAGAWGVNDPDMFKARPFATLDGFLYFTWPNGDRAQIWKSDGTPEGTVVALELNGAGDRINVMPDLIEWGSFIYFGDTGTEALHSLWRTDGTFSEEVAAYEPLFYGEFPAVRFIPLADSGLLFVDDVYGLYRTDGTAAGTQLVKGRWPSHYASADGVAYAMFPRLSTYELWRLTPSPETTGIIETFIDRDSDIRPYPATDMLFFNGSLLFIVPQDGVLKLWSKASDAPATPIHTVMDPLFASMFYEDAPYGRELFPFNAEVVFCAPLNPNWLSLMDSGGELWTTDGTTEGTRVLADVAANRASSAPRRFASLGDRLYFRADHPAAGELVWSFSEDSASTTLTHLLPQPSGIAQVHTFRLVHPPATLALYAGANFRLPINATSTAGPLTYHWKKDGTELPEGALEFDDAVASANGAYTCTVSDGVSALTTRPVQVQVAPLPEGDAHTADVNGNWSINLSELMRLIQFFNVGEYHCAGESEDGYATGAGSQDCAPHDSDYAPIDWTISLTELLRLVQFFNMPAGSYHPAPGSEDHFGAGADA